MKDKLSSRRGFSLTEMLMAVLLLALMTLVIGGGVTVVKNAYERITLRAEADTLLSTAISAVTGELRTAEVIRIEELPADSGDQDAILAAMSFENKDRGYAARFVNNDSDSDGNTDEICVQPVAPGTDPLPLLTDKTLTNNLKTKIEISYPENSLIEDDVSKEIYIKPDDFYFIIEVTVLTSDDKSFRSQEIKIRPVNLT